MEIEKISEEIIKLKVEDLELRTILMQKGELQNGYNFEMETLHIRNALRLNEIINHIGYPTISKVGKEASDAAWLIIQHSISQPKFMQRCAELLEEAVNNKEARPIHLAYLKDRIATYLGRPQLYGTSFDWDEKGALSPQPFDDIHLVNHRRKTLGLNTLEEQTEVIRKQAENENHFPPSDLAENKKAYNEWRKKVGWI